MRFLKSLTILAVLASFTASAQAADLLIAEPASIEPDSVFAWEGFYAGATLGGTRLGGVGFINLGAVAGVNFELSPGIIAGIEGQLTGYFRNGEYVGYEGLVAGRLGAVVADDVMVYGTLGAGTIEGTLNLYQVGAGVEYAVSSNVSLRGEVAALGAFGFSPQFYRATVGALYHFN